MGLAEQLSIDVATEADGTVMKVHCLGFPYGFSLEDSEILMTRVIYALMDYADVTRIQLLERRIYEYDYTQTRMLKEIASTIKYIRSSDHLFRPAAMSNQPGDVFVSDRFRFVQSMVIDLLPRDPIGAYVEIVRNIRHGQIEVEREENPYAKSSRAYFVENVLLPLKSLLERCTLIKSAQPSIEGFELGDRSLYRQLLRASSRPDFTFTKLMSQYPKGAEQVDTYLVNGAEVSIFRLPEDVRFLYHILPPEFKLTDTQYAILDSAREIMIRHRPTTAELIEPDRVRASMTEIAHDLIRENSLKLNYSIRTNENKLLAEILARETAGFGVIELIVADPKVQDISVNSPTGVNPISIYHADYEDCQTNVVPTAEEVESWAARLRLVSGRPLDQSNPVLDTGIEIPGARARVAAITRNLSPYGLAFSFRRHRDDPWTFPLFIKNRMMTPLAAGLLSFFVDGSRTMLVAGTRSSGKTSLLGALMLEIMRRYRIITVEDTLELPLNRMQRLQYNIQSLKVQSAITQLATEVSAADGIRTSLRMGDSALIVGEVRSKEAVALYEAMRVGALANVVAGTIHGDSPYGVFDRVVNDLGVPPTSFKATDLVLVANPIRTADGLHRVRRLVQITEVRKHWQEDPEKEKGFVDLLQYDAKEDILKPTTALVDGESEIISQVASRVKDWIGNFDSVWDNINLRANVKQALVEYADASANPALLEAPFVVRSNDMFHLISEKVRKENGSLVSKYILEQWTDWLKSSVKVGRI